MYFSISVYSPLKSIGKGVSQCSVLGPILFLIYINDKVNASSKLDFIIYADNTSLLLKDKNLLAAWKFN